MTNEQNTNSSSEQLTVLSFGGGQDSTALLYKYAHMTDAQVAEIKKLLGTIPQKEIAERFGVCAAQISHIKHGRQWKHIL